MVNELYSFIPEKVTRFFLVVTKDEAFFTGDETNYLALYEYREGESVETETEIKNLFGYDYDDYPEDLKKADLKEISRDELNEYAKLYEAFSEGEIRFEEYERRVKALLNIE